MPVRANSTLKRRRKNDISMPRAEHSANNPNPLFPSLSLNTNMLPLPMQCAIQSGIVAKSSVNQDGRTSPEDQKRVGVLWNYIDTGSMRCRVGNVCRNHPALISEISRLRKSCANTSMRIHSIILWQYLSWITPLVWQTPTSYAIPVECGLSLFGLTYQTILTFDAIRAKNNVQVYNICICNLLLLVFTIMRIGQTEHVYDQMRGSRAQVLQSTVVDLQPTVDLSMNIWKVIYPVLITASVLVGVCLCGLLAFGYKLHKEFAWAIYRHVSGSRQTRRRFLTYKVNILLRVIPPDRLPGNADKREGAYCIDQG